MSRWFSPLTGTVCLFLLIPAALCRAQTATTTVQADLDHDGTLETISLSSTEPFALSVRHGQQVVWSAVPQEWYPWKFQIVDVDGDGNMDIAVGVHKSTRFFREPHNCLFIYGWSGRRGYPKWLGSALSRPFIDFRFLTTPVDSLTLLAVERGPDQRLSVASYQWNGFGFSLEQRYGDWDPDVRLTLSSSGLTQIER